MWLPSAGNDARCTLTNGLGVQRRRVVPHLASLAVQHSHVATGVARVALPSRCFVILKRLAVVSGSGEASVVSDVDALYGRRVGSGSRTLLRTATRLFQEVATRSTCARWTIRSLAGDDLVERSLLRTVWLTQRPIVGHASSVIRAGLVRKSPEGTIELQLPEGPEPETASGAKFCENSHPIGNTHRGPIVSTALRGPTRANEPVQEE